MRSIRSIAPKVFSSYAFERHVRPAAPYPTGPVGTPQGWYDAANVASLTITSNKVSQWNDLMGSFNLTQGTAGSRPLYNASPRTINGVTIPEWSGTVFMDSNLPRDSRTMTCFVVGLTDTLGANRTMVGTTTSTSGNQFRQNTSNQPETLAEGSSTLSSMSNGIMTAAVPFIAVQQLDASNITHWFVSSGLVLCAKETDANATTFTAGRVTRLGCRSTGTTEIWDGLIAEVVQYSSTLSNDDVKRNLNYLAHKWAITGP